MNPFALGLAAAAVMTLAISGSFGGPEAIVPGDRRAPRVVQTESVAQWPVSPATVERSFQAHEQFGPGHRGTDLRAWPGQSVRSALSGVVAFAGQVAGRGVVVVSHEGDLRTTYLPLRPDVAVGDHVDAGDRVGHVSDGLHCPTSCLHWGARRGERYIDPQTLLPAPVVLLPP